jgi:Ran GTPase-activating protein (RanGAP) involved in mRNA processing and transport
LAIRDIPVDVNEHIKRLRIAQDNSNVNELYFWRIYFCRPVVESLRNLLSRDNRTWKSIKLLACSGLVDTVVSTILRSKRVDAFVLSGYETDNRTLVALKNGLKSNHTLKSLRLLGINFVDHYVSLEGLMRNTSLEELDLTRSKLGRTAVKSFARALNNRSRLRILKLEYCFLKDEAIAELVKSLAHCPTIEELHLCSNSCRSRAFQAISSLLEAEDTRLCSLDFHAQLLRHEEKLDISSISDALCHNKSLKYLDLSNNSISDHNIANLGSALRFNSTLKELEMHDCDITDRGIRCFASSLHDVKVKSLNLGGNSFRDEGVRDLFEGLRSNINLEQLGLFRRFACSDSLEYYLDLNWVGRRAFQESLPLALWPHVLARANNITMRVDSAYCTTRGRREAILYELLRGPALFER